MIFVNHGMLKKHGKYLNDLGDGRYLNINVYSEADKEEYDLRREMGI
jgi:hypothetical protein